MTSIDFVRLTQSFVESSAPFDYLLLLLARIAKAHDSLRATVSSLAAAQDNSSQVMPAHIKLTSNLRDLMQEIRTTFETRKVWAGVEDFGRRARKLAESDLAQEIAEEIGVHLSRFSEAYEQFVKNYSVETTFALMDTGNDLHVAVESLRITAVLTGKALLPTSPVTEGETELYLSFSSTPDLAEFVSKLATIVKLYEKLCELFDISTATNPLRIAKVETGTWAALVIGSLPVLKVMSHLIEEAARYVYRNYTKEGKISMLPRKAEAVEAILNLKKQLDEANIDTAHMKANIQNASTVLANDLNTLLAGEPRVVINATEITAAGEWDSKQLLGGRELLEDAEPATGRLPPPPAPEENG